MRQAASLAETIRADARRSANEAFIDSANQLGDVLDALNKAHGFEPPTAPGLRFSRKGRASLEGYLARPCSGTDA